MHSENRFADLSDSLENGFLADEIVLAVARVQQGQHLGPQGRACLDKAVNILKSAIEGHQWLDHPKVTPATKEASNFFSRAVEALPRVYSSAVFIQQVGELRDTAEAILAGKPVSADKLVSLRSFFFNAGQSELDRTEELLQREGRTDTPRWAVETE